MKFEIDPDSKDGLPLLTILSAKGGFEPNFQKFLKERAKLPNPNVYDIELRINGVEFDYLEFTREYMRQMNELIKRRAEALIEDKLEPFREKLEGFRELLDTFESDAKEKLK